MNEVVETTHPTLGAGRESEFSKYRTTDYLPGSGLRIDQLKMLDSREKLQLAGILLGDGRPYDSVR